MATPDTGCAKIKSGWGCARGVNARTCGPRDMTVTTSLVNQPYFGGRLLFSSVSSAY